MIASPIHEASVIPSPTQPGQWPSAPMTMKKTVAANCQKRWWKASSFVSHDAKKLGSRRGTNFVGRKALIVKRSPTRLTQKKNQDQNTFQELPNAGRGTNPRRGS